MDILKRFKSIMSANMSAVPDKTEASVKELDQCLRSLESDLGKVKAQTASVMAEEKRAKHALDACDAEIDRMQTYAEKALLAGNEADARAFLIKKQQIAEERIALEEIYLTAADNAMKMRQMHDKLTSDMQILNARREVIRAKFHAAQTQQRVNKVASSAKGDALSAFDRMEERVNKMLDATAAE